MGWYGQMYSGKVTREWAEDYLDAQLAEPWIRKGKGSLVGNSFFAPIENIDTGAREIFVMLLSRCEGEVMTKNITGMGPSMTTCPERILKFLDGYEVHEYTRDWVERCRAARRDKSKEKLTDGCRLRFFRPVGRDSIFVYHAAGEREPSFLRGETSGLRYKVPRLWRRYAEII